MIRLIGICKRLLFLAAFLPLLHPAIASTSTPTPFIRSVISINPGEPSLHQKFKVCLLAGDVSCVIAQWMLISGYKEAPSWMIAFRNSFATANRAAGKCIEVAKAIHQGFLQMGQSPRFVTITVEGKRPLLGFDEIVDGKLPARGSVHPTPTAVSGREALH